MVNQENMENPENIENQENIKNVVAEWRTTSDNQKKIVVFDFSKTSPSASVSFSSSAKSLFELKSLTLVDFDEGSLRLDRSSLQPLLGDDLQVHDISLQ